MQYDKSRKQLIYADKLNRTKRKIQFTCLTNMKENKKPSFPEKKKKYRAFVTECMCLC